MRRSANAEAVAAAVPFHVWDEVRLAEEEGFRVAREGAGVSVFARPGPARPSTDEVL